MKQDPILRGHPLAPAALFIDGENLPPSAASRIVGATETIGPRGIRRVYGDAARMTGRRQQGTLQIVDSAQGKNAADILLAIEAMEVALKDGIRTIAIASRDRDFSHLARKLAEHGVRVVGIGTADEDCAFRKACTDYRVIAMPGPVASGAVGTSAPDAKPPVDPDKLRKWIETVLGQSDGKCLTITALAKAMNDRHGVTKAQLPAGKWKTYLLSDPRFEVDDAQMVRLAKKKPPQGEGS